MKRLNGEGNIRRRENGSWEARYYDAQGNRHSVYAKTQREVKQKLDAAIKHPALQKRAVKKPAASNPAQSAHSKDMPLTADTPFDPYAMECGDMTVGQWLTTWRRDYTLNIKQSTAVYYDQLLNTHIIPTLGDIALQDLHAPAIQHMYIEKLQNGLSAKSIKNLHGCLHKALDVAVRIGYLPSNPSNGCILPRVEQKEIHPIDLPDLKKLLSSLKGEEYEALIIVAIFTGMRSGELLGLTWDCIDFDNGVIRVDKQLVTPRKKGDVCRFGTTKNSKGRLLTPAPLVMEALKAHREAQERQRKAIGPVWNDGGFPNLVFTHPDGSHLSQPTVWKILQKVLKKAGLETHHRFHDLRHTYVVNSIRAGDDIKTVQQNAGHYSASFTLDRYAHVTETMRRESADRMQRFYEALA